MFAQQLCDIREINQAIYISVEIELIKTGGSIQVNYDIMGGLADILSVPHARK